MAQGVKSSAWGTQGGASAVAWASHGSVGLQAQAEERCVAAEEEGAVLVGVAPSSEGAVPGQVEVVAVEFESVGVGCVRHSHVALVGLVGKQDRQRILEVVGGFDVEMHFGLVEPALLVVIPVHAQAEIAVAAAACYRQASAGDACPSGFAPSFEDLEHF